MNLSPKEVGSCPREEGEMPRVLAPHVVGGLLAAISSSCKDVSLSGRSTAASLLITSVQPARACPSLCVHRVMKTSEEKKKILLKCTKPSPVITKHKKNLHQNVLGLLRDFFFFSCCPGERNSFLKGEVFSSNELIFLRHGLSPRLLLGVFLPAGAFASRRKWKKQGV